MRMSMAYTTSDMIEITHDKQFWERTFSVHSLVVIGSREKEGHYNLAPKHLALPLGFERYFGYLDTKRKATYHNVLREKVFTVSFPRPEQLVLTSFTASPREEDFTKPVIRVLEEVVTEPARQIDGLFLKDAYLQLECRLVDRHGEFGEWELMAGEVIAAYVHKDALRISGDDMDDDRLIRNAPLLAYLHPDRFAIVKESHTFPFPKDIRR